MNGAINLNRARKAKARRDAGAQAAANRVVFGMTKAAKAVARSAEAKSARTLDGHKREP